MAALFGVNHPLFEIEQLRRCDLNALDADRRAVAIRPEVAGEDVAEKISFHQLVVLDPRGKAVLPLKVRVGLRMVSARVDGVCLPDIAPAVAGFRANMSREKIAPLGIHLEVRAGVASRADSDFQFVAATMAEPTG